VVAKLVEVEAECRSCSGTGLYQGFCEPKYTAVVCLNCQGTGCTTLKYKPFVKRRGKRGVKRVKRSAGAFIATGVGPVGDSITYAEFKDGKRP
jgi:DnaJ-class molecular chaperone